MRHTGSPHLGMLHLVAKLFSLEAIGEQDPCQQRGPRRSTEAAAELGFVGYLGDPSTQSTLSRSDPMPWA